MSHPVGGSALAVYGTLDKLGPQRKAVLAKDPLYKKDLQDFKLNVAKIKTVDDLFKNYKLLKTILEAYDLDSEISKAGFIKKILTSNPLDKKALVNQVNDNRYRDLAVDIGLYAGVDILKSSDFATKVQTKLAQTRYEREIDEENPGIRAALRFKASAAKIKTPYDVLSDPVLRDVILKATGLPLIIVRQTVESQARTLESRINFAKLKDPRYVEKIVKQYLSNVDADARKSATASANSGTLSLFA